jgi:hypothetical protein
MYILRNMVARSRNRRCRGKSIIIKYLSVSLLALAIRDAKCMRHVMLSSVACPRLQYFPTLSRKRHDFRGKVIENKMCVFIFCTTFV